MIKSKFLTEELLFYASKSTIPHESVGMISDDRSAVVGRYNWCFIYEGSNNYRNSYLNEGLIKLGKEWVRLIEARQRICEEMGIQFLQVIVPNKLTLIPEFFPEALNSDISFALKGIMKSEISANILAPVTEFRADNIRESIFRRNDSHLTIAGNSCLAELILNNLGLKGFDTSPVETIVVAHVGDLGGKFKKVISEELHAPIWSKGLLDKQGIKKVKDISSGGLNGVEQLFLNPSAPIKKKIMVIGNSFFERVPSWGLSPFFSALFKEYYFIWSPEFNAKAIEDFSPDIVLTQTCERFLNRLPVDYQL